MQFKGSRYILTEMVWVNPRSSSHGLCFIQMRFSDFHTACKIMEFSCVILFVMSFSVETVTVRATMCIENGSDGTGSAVVSSTECTICAYYSTASDVPGSVLLTARLPFSLAYDVHHCPTEDSRGWSAKISVDETPVVLKTLFKGVTRCQWLLPSRRAHRGRTRRRRLGGVKHFYAKFITSQKKNKSKTSTEYLYRLTIIFNLSSPPLWSFIFILTWNIFPAIINLLPAGVGLCSIQCSNRKTITVGDRMLNYNDVGSTIFIVRFGGSLCFHFFSWDGHTWWKMEGWTHLKNLKIIFNLYYLNCNSITGKTSNHNYNFNKLTKIIFVFKELIFFSMINS